VDGSGSVPFEARHSQGVHGYAVDRSGDLHLLSITIGRLGCEHFMTL
jgi:hypothetical protein